MQGRLNVLRGQDGVGGIPNHPLPFGQDARQRRAAGAQGDLLSAHLHVEQVARQQVQLIAAAERYRREAVAPSADLVRIAEAAYRAGESTVLELLDAYKGALEAETMALDLEGKARDARIELDQLTGSHPE